MGPDYPIQDQDIRPSSKQVLSYSTPSNSRPRSIQY